MRPQTARTTQWLRFTTAVIALFWALGVAAGCHLPHGSATASSTSSRVAAGLGHGVATLAHLAPTRGDPCSPLHQTCKHVPQACSTYDAVELAVVASALPLAGSLASPVVPAPRGPPRTDGFVLYRSGRNILTRFCIARI
ncbi:putative copper homeostasis (lipo)protein LpqS [Mycobacterium paraseoulense]